MSVVAAYPDRLGRRKEPRPEVTKNKRYESRYDELQAQRQAEADASPKPVTLPSQAFGPQPIEWPAPADRPSVRAWVQWDHGPATRIVATAHGWNDRVVVVRWDTDFGPLQTTVWRGAVTRRLETATRGG